MSMIAGSGFVNRPTVAKSITAGVPLQVLAGYYLRNRFRYRYAIVSVKKNPFCGKKQVFKFYVYR